MTLVLQNQLCVEHWAGQGHPEQPARIDAVLGAARELERAGSLRIETARLGSDDDVLLVHTDPYLALVKDEVGKGYRELSTGDVALSKRSLEAAMAAVGCLTGAVDAVMTGAAKNAFCAVRPPGHHASAARGMGFCIFNNIAIAARYAQKKHGVKRVLIVDWDVHHGNGTQDVFWSDGSVMLFDTHLSPFYPGTGDRDETGAGKGAGFIVNRPMPAGAGRKEILSAYLEDLVPAADRFKPDLVLLSAGFDSRIDDPLGGLRLTDQDYADLTDVLTGIARRHASGRLVSTLEGGYSLSGLTNATDAHLRRLCAA